MQHVLATVKVIYYLPDYNSLLNEFMWQTMDICPDFPRVYKFIDHWENNIQADIQTILLQHCDPFKHKGYTRIIEIKNE